jgi:hypothetical protein
LLAQLSAIDREIAATLRQIREVPLQVLGPQVDEALTRVRAKVAELAITPVKLAPLLDKFKVGEKVTVTMSPARAGIVLRAMVDPQTKREGRLLLVEDGSLVFAPLEELKPFTVTSQPSPTPEISGSTETGSTPGTTIPQTSTSGLAPGDPVDTPLGPGRIKGLLPGSTDVYEVVGVPNAPVYFHRTDLHLRQSTSS